MSTTKDTTKGKGGKAARPKLSTPAAAAIVFDLLHDRQQSDAGRQELLEWFDQLINSAGIDYSDAPIFPLAFPRAARFVEQGKGRDRAMGAEQAYRALQAIITRTANGETLEQIAQARSAAMSRSRARHQQAELSAPEPKDKLSDAWRYWQLRRLERDFRSGDSAAYQRAWAYFHKLLNGLRADREFERADFATALLPHLLIARQEIDETRRYERRMRAGMKGAETRKRNARKGDQR